MNDPQRIGPAKIESNIDDLHKNYQSTIFDEPTERDKSVDVKSHKTKQTNRSKKEAKPQKKSLEQKKNIQGKKNVSFGEELHSVIYIEKYDQEKASGKLCRCLIF